jgi:menaquinone-specific isochorismate synthase
MSFSAVAFQLSDAQVAQLPDQIIGKSTCAFSRHQLGKLGFGERFRFTTRGTNRFSAARDRWSELTDVAPTVLPSSLSAAAPVCFAAFTFDARSAFDSMVIVPKFVLDRTPGSTWLHYTYDATTVLRNPEEIFAEFLNDLPAEPPVASHTDFTTVAAQLSEAAFQDAVQTAVEMLAQQDFEKIVLARDELLKGAAEFHVPATMRALAGDNPTAWTYKVDNLIGSTPELLIARQANAAKARVLAGTVDRDVAINEQLIAEQLSESPKQIFEHQAAVDSLVEKLAPFATQLQVSERPFVLPLPNVYHLATDVSAELTSSTSILDLVAEINPTAAVGGTPREAAVEAIWQLEAETHGMDRGLYAGAVGWLDAEGQGEFGIALRGSIIEDAHHVRVFAGGGIVEGSDPEAELAETHAKMRPMKKALRIRST